MVISVKFTLFPCVVALFFAVPAVIAAENPDSPTAPLARTKTADLTERQQKSPLIPDGTNLFGTLRFWEKKPQPKSVKGVLFPPPVPQTSRQQETSSVTHNVPVEQSDSPATYLVPAHLCPEPENAGYGDAPIPAGQTSNLVNDFDSNTITSQEAKSNPAYYSSYSFDTRDWVESFPMQIAPPETVSVTTQKTSLRSPIQNPPQERRVDNAEDSWNGQATTLATFNLPNSSAEDAAIPPPSALAPPEKPLIDLSPSYQKRLPHSTTCGVVVVQANFSLTEIVSILEEINMLQGDLKHYIGIPAPLEKIELCLFKDEASYMDFLKEFFPKAPRDRRALYIKLDNKPGTLLVQKSKNFEIDLRHEMTHAIIHASIPVVPIWLDEGLAKYFELSAHDRAAGGPYMSQIRWNVRFGTVPALDRLAKLETIDDMGAKEYRDSWAWTHFLIHRSPETHQLLASYLQLLVELRNDKVHHSRIPSLKLYLDDMIPNQRDAFKDHFSVAEKIIQL